MEGMGWKGVKEVREKQGEGEGTGTGREGG